MQGWGLQARPSSTVPSHTPSSGWQPRLRTWTPPPHSWLQTDQRPQPAQPSAGGEKRRGAEWAKWDARTVAELTEIKVWWNFMFKIKVSKCMSLQGLSINFIYQNRRWVMFVLCAENGQGRVLWAERSTQADGCSILNGNCVLLTTWCEPPQSSVQG